MKEFTNLSETLSPTELVGLLNEYLDGMTQILKRNGGTLDKYERDARIEFGNAPLSQEDHAERAVKTPLEMQKLSALLNKKFQRQGKPPLMTRIGIVTGKVIVGAIGSKKRFNYTIIGDEAGLAARLESAN